MAHALAAQDWAAAADLIERHGVPLAARGQARRPQPPRGGRPRPRLRVGPIAGVAIVLPHQRDQTAYYIPQPARRASSATEGIRRNALSNRFALPLVGLCVLLSSVIVETPSASAS